jgi:hypothetical protein
LRLIIIGAFVFAGIPLSLLPPKAGDKTARVKASLTLKFVEKAGQRQSDKMAHCQLKFTLARIFMSI